MNISSRKNPVKIKINKHKDVTRKSKNVSRDEQDVMNEEFDSTSNQRTAQDRSKVSQQKSLLKSKGGSSPRKISLKSSRVRSRLDSTGSKG
jgi:hypothetical protein